MKLSLPIFKTEEEVNTVILAAGTLKAQMLNKQLKFVEAKNHNLRTEIRDKENANIKYKAILKRLAEWLTTGEPIEDIVNAARTALKMPTKGVDGESF